MISMNDPKKITYLVGDNTKDIQQRQVYVEDQNGTMLSMESLGKRVAELIEKRKDDIAPITALGSGLFGASKAYGFMVGYLVKTLLVSYEESSYKAALAKDPNVKRDEFKLAVKMNETPVSKQEFREWALEEIEELKKLISTDDEMAFKQIRNDE